MNFSADSIAQCRIDHLMPGQTALSSEARTDDHSLVMPLAIRNDLGTRLLKTLLNQTNNLVGIHFQQVSFSTGKPDSLSQMAANARNLMLFLSLAGAALLTWVFARVAEEPAVAGTDSDRLPEGYYLLGALMSFTNDEGQTYYRIHAERVEQLAEDESFVLEDIRVEYAPETDVHWNITAARGLAPASRDLLHLQEDVRMAYSPDASQEETVFETDDLRLYATSYLATTDQQVTMRRNGSEVTATGLELNLETDYWMLNSDVAIHSQRR